MDEFSLIATITAFSMGFLLQCVFSMNIRHGVFILEDRLIELEKVVYRRAIPVSVELEDPNGET